MDDWELLREYAKDGSEAAFTQLVQRHLDWVYSVARRQVADPALAEEVAQSVFALLARKANSLRPGTILGGWLFRTTRFVAARAARSEIRRKLREQSAAAMNAPQSLNDESESSWNQIEPHLEDAVASLSDSDRSAVLLRFYEKLPLQEVGRRLGTSEDGARKRVVRAVEKLRSKLAGRGVVPGAVALGSILSVKVADAAPIALHSSVIKASLATTSGSGVLPELARQILEAWRWTRLKVAGGAVAMLSVAVFLAGQAWKVAHESTNAARSSSAVLLATTPGPAEASQSSPALSKTNVKSPTNSPHAMIHGLVMDEQGRAVIGAHVWSWWASKPADETTSDALGRFSLSVLGPGNFVTVAADGFSIDQQDVDTNKLSETLVFRLSEVAPLKFRVLDESGHAIQGADVVLENWWGHRTSLRYWQASDSDGRVQWLSAPKGELEFCVLKSGYRTTRQHKFVADDAEHTFVLHPALMLSGRVTDADSGKPVENFKMTRGYSQLFSNEETGTVWDFHERWYGTNGNYNVVFDEEHIPHLRIEAEGYDMFDIKPEFPTGAVSACDFQLQKSGTGHAIRGTVLLPDGTPAANVDVALCTFQVAITLAGTKFDDRLMGRDLFNRPAEFRHKTDANGGFSFSPKPSAHTVIAVCDAGMGKAHCFDSSKPLEIHLQPWGRIEGSVRTRDGKWAGRKIIWGATGTLHSGMDIEYSAVAAVSDSQGNFILEKVPPGNGHVQIQEGDGNLRSCITPVQVTEGETLHLQIGGTGMRVFGRLVAPKDIAVQSWTKQTRIAHLHPQWDSYGLPEGLQGEEQWRWQMRYAESEEGGARLRNSVRYELQVKEDGSFFAPEVLPGKYDLFISLNEGPLGSGPSSIEPFSYMRQIAALTYKFTIPEPTDGSATTLNLGDLVLTPTP
jgi:RNA polymerase sigma factor (sigma-70 family)